MINNPTPTNDNDDEITSFFTKTPVTRSECDSLATDLVGGTIIPVTIQGNCSYTVYGGANHEYVVQFRLESLFLDRDIAALAREIYGDLAPDVSVHREELGEYTVDGREGLKVYVMTRVPGISYLDFILKHGFPEDSVEICGARRNLVRDMARFFALSWQNPQEQYPLRLRQLTQTYEEDLQQLFESLPSRFHPIIQATLNSLPQIMSLPMVLLHKDLNDFNILVSEPSCHLSGVVDWAEAEIGPFGSNLHSLQNIMSKLHLKNGWMRYVNYDELVETFWECLSREVGGLSAETVRVIKAARVMGLLRSRGFTSRLANMPEAVPIKDDDDGRYNMMILDGLLLNPDTRFEDLG